MKKFGPVRLFLLLVLVLVLSVAPNVGAYFAKSNSTKQRLFGNEAEQECVLVVWNVDTFEGGTTGKSAVLENVGKEFERQNKGVFVLVRNLTVEEFLIALETERPDVFSFGRGLFCHVKDLAVALPFGNGLFDNVRQGLEIGDKTLAYSWCMGAYFVLATEESLARVGAESKNLIENCCRYSKDFSVGKKTKHVFSLEAGANEYCSAKDALLGQVEIENGAVDPAFESQSFYEAYVGFVNGNSTFLLGTQRDLARLENKKSQGAVSDVFGEVLNQTDLLQYVVAVETGNGVKQRLSELFCTFLISDYVQSRLLGFGLLPTCRVAEPKCESSILMAAFNLADKMSIKPIC